MTSVLILGIETSCDETSAAVVRDGREVLSNVISSQIELHRKTGGVVPEVAAREHAVKLFPVIDSALKKAGISRKSAPEKLYAIAVAKGPGLMTSLLMGMNAATTLALAWKLPLIPVNHIEGHIYANFTESSPKFPIVVLTVSGGHNELILWKGHGKYQFLGSTLDDAAGEAFDKVARLLGLSYPGGPEIQKIAKHGDPTIFPLPIPYPQTFDFSFSGIKTAVLYLLRDLENAGKKITPQIRHDIAASFQESVCEVLSEKLIQAAKKFCAKEIHLAGGVSANTRLREIILKKMQRENFKIKFRCPPLSLCTDNAAMIAMAGYFQFKKNPRKYKKWRIIEPLPNLPIQNWR